MRTLIKEIQTHHTPLSLAARIQHERDWMLLQSALCQGFDRLSILVANPFARLEVHGMHCWFGTEKQMQLQIINPWNRIEQWIQKYELHEESDAPFPLGGIFGFWGYELNRSLISKLDSKAIREPKMPDLCAGFYDSLCVFDHRSGKCFAISNGMQIDGSRCQTKAQSQLDWWIKRLQSPLRELRELREIEKISASHKSMNVKSNLSSNLSRADFITKVIRVKQYLASGDIYQINLSHRFALPFVDSCFDFYTQFVSLSPAPFAAYLKMGRVEIASASPESFLRISGRHIRTRPIKGTRPRARDRERDAQLAFELQSSPKELAELMMIVDLLRNDLGQICEFGSVRVPELIRLERYPQVQHLVSTIEGRLRAGLSHCAAFAKCFPGGSITGVPKLRAMQIIDELEPQTRGPYTGAIGFIGFNSESHLSIAIRTAYKIESTLFFNAGAGIVADSDPESEYEETLDKARGFLETIAAMHSKSKIIALK